VLMALGHVHEHHCHAHEGRRRSRILTGTGTKRLITVMRTTPTCIAMNSARSDVWARR
jgi:hypothetical protein